MTTPDREAFLRKLEGDNMKGPPPSTQQMNEDTLRFLQEAGLDSIPIDPASLETLQKIVTPTKHTVTEEMKPAAIPTDQKSRHITFELPESSSSMSRAPVKEIQTKPSLNRLTSELTVGADTLNSNATTAGSTGQGGVENLILQRLELQTQMIVDMQYRIENLTNMVHHLQQNQGGIPLQQQNSHSNYSAASAAGFPPQGAPRQIFGPGGPTMIPPMGALHIPQQQPNMEQHQQPQVAPAQMGPPPPPPQTLFASLCDYVKSWWARISESRTAEAWRVFWALHRRHVRLDGGLIFKVFFVVTVFSAKLMTRKNRKGDFWSPTAKFHLVLGLVMIGFLIQTGYVQFFYRFFYKENILERIYGGETIDVDQVDWRNPPAPRRPGAGGIGGNGNLRNLIPRNNLVAGNIPAPRNGMNILMDIAVLFGSFLLSILPMWKPEGPVRQAAPQAPAPPQEQPVPPHQGPPQQGPNAVAAPRDFDQFAADDDDDEDDDQPPHQHQD